MRLREALLILSLISAFGCHSHASGPLVVVQCPGPEIDEPIESSDGGVSIPFYGASPLEDAVPESITADCNERNGWCGQSWAFDVE